MPLNSHIREREREKEREREREREIHNIRTPEYKFHPNNH